MKNIKVIYGLGLATLAFGSEQSSKRPSWEFYCAALILLGSLHTPAVDYTVQGTIMYELWHAGGKVYVHQEDKFDVSVSGCLWRIQKFPRLFLKDGKPQPLADYGVVCTDGKNFYQVSSRNQGTSRNARVGPGTVPFCLSDPKLIVLWYGFASGCYFERLTDNYVNPIAMFSEDKYAGDFRVLGRWQLNSNSPFLPETMVFDALPRFDVLASKSGTHRWNFTNITFTASGFSSGGGKATIPQSIVVDFFRRTPDLKVSSSGRVKIEVHDVQHRIPFEAFRPPDLGNAIVSDMRTISSNTPFGIARLNQSNWPSVEASKDQAAKIASAMKKRTDSAQRNPKLARTAFAVAFLGPPLVAAVIWLGRYYSKQKANKL